MDEKVKELLEAAKHVLWKLDNNFCLADKKTGFLAGYKGPALISRQDATIRLLQYAVDKIQDKE